jgi:general secretion pathway protein K
VLDAVADWIDADGVPRASGAEDAAYREAHAAALTANAPLLRTAELASVRGLSGRDVNALTPYVIALPAGTALNVNTASAEVLAAAIPELEGDALAAFVADRTRKPFATMSELRARLPHGVTIADDTAFTMASSYFLVSVRSRQGVAVAQARALLKRDGREWPVVVWQTLE